MSRVHGDAHAEQLIRDAALAIGRDIGHWVWNPVLYGLRDPSIPLIDIPMDKFFAPLHEAAHAYEIETTLCINVDYKWRDQGVVLMQMSRTGHGGAVMYTIGRDDDHLRVRREAVVIFASLTLVMDSKGDRELIEHE